MESPKKRARDEAGPAPATDDSDESKAKRVKPNPTPCVTTVIITQEDGDAALYKVRHEDDAKAAELFDWLVAQQFEDKYALGQLLSIDLPDESAGKFDRKLVAAKWNEDYGLRYPKNPKLKERHARMLDKLEELDVGQWEEIKFETGEREHSLISSPSVATNQRVVMLPGWC
jgi:hypothetical protein